MTTTTDSLISLLEKAVPEPPKGKANHTITIVQPGIATSGPEYPRWVERWVLTVDWWCPLDDLDEYEQDHFDIYDTCDVVRPVMMGGTDEEIDGHIRGLLSERFGG